MLLRQTENVSTVAHVHFMLTRLAHVHFDLSSPQVECSTWPSEWPPLQKAVQRSALEEALKSGEIEGKVSSELLREWEEHWTAMELLEKIEAKKVDHTLDPELWKE